MSMSIFFGEQRIFVFGCGESLPRNERITNVMNKVGNIESVGTGTQEMIKECKELDKPEPEYIERGNTFIVCFKANTEKISERQKKILSLLKQHSGLQNADILNLTRIE